MSGVPWMDEVEKNYAENEELKGSGIPGVEPPVGKFLEGTSYFRILPRQECIPQILNCVNAGDWNGAKTASAYMPTARAQVYLPGRNDDDAGGISLFNEARVSCFNAWPGEPESVKIPDPIDRLLEDVGVRWEKTENLDPRGKAIRAAAKRSDRVLMQILNLGINGSEWKHGESAVTMLFLASKDFEEKFKYALLRAPADRGFVPMDIFYGGINMQVVRKGKQRDTTYQMQGMFPQQGSQWGYPVFSMQGQPDIAEMTRVLGMVKPWSATIKKATAEELIAAWKEMMVKIDAKFMAGSVQVPGIPGAGSSSPPGMPQSGPPGAPAGHAGPPATPPAGPPAMPPQGPPAGNPSGPPAMPPQGPPAGSAPMPPQMGTPGGYSYQQSAPAAPQGVPNLGAAPPAMPPQGSPAGPPAGPPAMPPQGPPAGPPASGIDQSSLNQQVYQHQPPQAGPPGIPAGPPGAPPGPPGAR